MSLPLSHVQLFATPWTVARQALLSMGFLRQGHWSGLPFASPEDLLDPKIEPGSPALQVGSLLSELPGVYFPNFPYRKFQVKLRRLKHMICYETQQSQCSWGPW